MQKNCQKQKQQKKSVKEEMSTLHHHSYIIHKEREDK